MNRAAGRLRDAPVNIRAALSALWVALMFLFIYVDQLALFEPGVLDRMRAGKLGAGVPVTQGTLLAAMTLMAVPALLIFLTLVSSARWSRRMNMAAAIVYLIVVAGNTLGETWAFYLGASVLEAAVLLMILILAWRWPRDREALDTKRILREATERLQPGARIESYRKEVLSDAVPV